MLSPRAEIVLNSIVRQYIVKAVPVSSGSVIEDCGLGVCSATVRNEVARLEHLGYIIRPHHAAGSVPSDKAYRHYVETVETRDISNNERFMINHLFHQVEKEMDQWLRLTASLIARRVHNVAIISSPKSNLCKLHRIELVALQDSLILAVLILRGAKVKQQLINFGKQLGQFSLVEISNRLSGFYAGKTRKQMEKSKLILSEDEILVKEAMIRMMKAEDDKASEDSYLDGLQFLLEQPEFSHGEKAQELMELVEGKRLNKAISPDDTEQDVRVLIGDENKDEAIKDYSVIVGRYGVSGEAEGTIGVVGPKRMQYDKAITTIRYLSLVMSKLVAELYGSPNENEENQRDK